LETFDIGKTSLFENGAGVNACFFVAAGSLR
jgi:hypothetical protein